MNRNQKGFSVVEVLIVMVVLALLGGIGWKVLGGKKDQSKDSTSGYTQGTPSAAESAQKQESTVQELIWQQAEGGWRSTQTPPACPAQPIMKMPADISKVTGILYPGQTRGGNYKPHGGFRFDGTANDKVTVKAPVDGFIVRGGRYLAEGEVQYTFDVMNNCGVMYRVGHFRVLPANLQRLADTWPAAVEGDSRTQQVNPAVFVKQGETLATAVGIIKAQNTFFDWGIYDYREQNQASKSVAYQQAHAQDKELSWHAVCWFNWLPASDSTKVKSLPPGDPTSGKTSDYCK
jgi:prepilin-type N-terminal cleavage/methylation domain-containing protein